MLGFTDPTSVPTQHLNSWMAVVSTAHPTARCDLPSSGAYALHRHILLHAHMPFSAQFSLSQSGFHTCSPSWASGWLCPRPGRSPVSLLSCNWELLSSWGFHFWPHGHTVAVPVSHLTTLHAHLDPLSFLPSSACDLPRR